MSEFRQPWHRADFGEHRVRVQVLDPVTAFDLEPQIVARFGDALAMTLAAPGQILESVWSTVAGATGGPKTFAQALADPDPGLGVEVAADGLRLLARVLASGVASSSVDGAWLSGAWKRMLLRRIEVDGEPVETLADWVRLGLGPLAKWHVLAAQVRQTFGPLWTRSPYVLRSSVKDFGVPTPKGVPIATQWAAMLAKTGQAPSAVEITRDWTPVQLIEVVEAAAMLAEREQRAYDAAMATSKGKR